MMKNPPRFEIACYLAWCGAEAIFGPFNRVEYDAVRSFLERIAKLPLQGDEVLHRFSGTVSDYYVIEAHERTAFQQFMQDRTRGGLHGK